MGGLAWVEWDGIYGMGFMLQDDSMMDQLRPPFSIPESQTLLGSRTLKPIQSHPGAWEGIRVWLWERLQDKPAAVLE